MSTTWLMSDTHFGHVNLLNYEPHRLSMFGITADPDNMAKTTAEADEALMTHLNEIISPDDEVYFLGDVAMGKRDVTVPFTAKLHGHKHLVAPGNHDVGMWPGTVKNPDKQAAVRRMWVDAGWTLTFTAEFNGGPFVFLSHAHTYGHLPLSGTPDHGDVEDPRYAQHMVPYEMHRLPHVHGHSHGHNGRIHDDGKQFDVGIDANGLRPTSGDEIIDFINAHNERYGK
jgi:calcineurin-like phosphoesterase family protein